MEILLPNGCCQTLDAEAINESSIVSCMEPSSSKALMQTLLHSQRELLFSQLDEFQRIVIAQCRLTGINPLSQEMAAGALSIKIGKRPRDLLSPKAAKFLQGIFAIKDTITKREARDLSALCGATITQVREFFAGQRSRVRRFIRQSKTKKKGPRVKNTAKDKFVITANSSSDSTSMLLSLSENEKRNVIKGTCKRFNNNISCQSLIISGNGSASKECTKMPNSDICGERELLDLNFIKSFLLLMRKENTFSGQVDLLDKILKIQDHKILFWFVSKGGLPILAKWLGVAYTEEQTTVLDIIFKVLSHLPLHRALPVQMSSILQTVNKLRFYRTQEISNRSRILLSRWSKLFGKTQGGRKVTSLTNQDSAEKGLQALPATRKSVNETFIKQSDYKYKRMRTARVDLQQNANKMPDLPPLSSRPLRICQNVEENIQPSDTSRKGSLLSSQPEQPKERRKVLLVEDPSPGIMRKKMNTGRLISKNYSRPLSTDDIQKAKKRAHWIERYDCLKQRDCDFERIKSSALLMFSNCSQQAAKMDFETDDKKENSSEIPVPGSCNAEKLPTHNGSQGSPANEDQPSEEARIPWTIPPEIFIDPSWRVSSGEESKEVELQSERVKREKEATYPEEPIPFCPKEPWDIELEYDDSLTPQIPLETTSVESSLTMSLENRGNEIGENMVDPKDEVSSSQMKNDEEVPYIECNSTNVGKAFRLDALNSSKDYTPDLELLAILLKNPDLVFALTSEKGSHFSEEQKVALLDLLKATSSKEENLCRPSNSVCIGDSVTSKGFTNAEEINTDKQKADNTFSTPFQQSVEGLAEPIASHAVPSSTSKSEARYPPTWGTEEGKINDDSNVENTESERNQNTEMNGYNNKSAFHSDFTDNRDIWIHERQQLVRGRRCKDLEQSRQSQRLFQRPQKTGLHPLPTVPAKRLPEDDFTRSRSSSVKDTASSSRTNNTSAFSYSDPRPRPSKKPKYNLISGANSAATSPTQSEQQGGQLRSGQGQTRHETVRPNTPFYHNSTTNGTQRSAGKNVAHDPSTSSIDRIRSLVMDFGKDDGRDQANYAPPPSSSMLGPIVPLPPLHHQNNVVGPAAYMMNVVRPEYPPLWDSPQGPHLVNKTYSQRPRGPPVVASATPFWRPAERENCSGRQWQNSTNDCRSSASNQYDKYRTQHVRPWPGRNAPSKASRRYP
eukprot:TRINITY_DN8696_c0_g1_i1.p1 TRINITY_DN8696_c0_g1~~TRINITY_DN8696_c0_g1_i1.p1  ORF type:complete len:1187 (-),score=265.59 TRINITY_DN8696_c0_g1_i1:419-3979(-)